MNTFDTAEQLEQAFIACHGTDTSQREDVDMFSKVLDIGLAHIRRGDYMIRPVKEPTVISFEMLSEEGISDEEFLLELANISEQSACLSSPGFLGFPDGASCKPALAAAMLEPFLNQNLANHNILAPHATFIELQTIHWLRELAGYETSRSYQAAAEIGGILTPGGCLSNTIAIMAAKERCFPGSVQSGLPTKTESVRVLVPEQFEHYSIRSAMGWLSLGQQNIQRVPADPDGRMDLSALDSTICKQKAAGNVILACIAYAGDSRSMSVDNLSGIAKVLEKYNIWFHVDACHGLQLAFSRNLRQRIEGIERAHSISFDPHKVLCLPYSCSAVLFRDPQDLTAVRVNSDLILNTRWSLGQITPFLGSKSFMALKLWCTMKYFGRSGLERLINHRIEMTTRIQHAIGAQPDLLLLNVTDINSCMFVFTPQTRLELGRLSTEDVQKISETNDSLALRLRNEGEFFVHTFPLQDWKHSMLPCRSHVKVLRIMNGSGLRDSHVIDKLLKRIVELGYEIWTEKGYTVVAQPLPALPIFTTLRYRLLNEVMIANDHVAVLYGSSVNEENRIFKDLDMMVFGPDDFVEAKTTSQIVGLWKAVMKEFALYVDEEVPLRNKLLIPFSFAERAAASADGHLSQGEFPAIVSGQGSSRKVVMDTSSNVVLARLVFNVLTVPTLTLSSTTTASQWLDATRNVAEKALVKLITRRMDQISEMNENDFAKKAIGEGPTSGECFLGYKDTPLISNHLKEVWLKHSRLCSGSKEVREKMLPTFLIINGFPGVGKFTIARELHKWLPNSRFIDNHALIDPVVALEPNRTAAHHQVRKGIRAAVIKGMIDVKAPILYIVTECLSSDAKDCDIMLEFAEVARRRQIPLTFVNLTCSFDVTAQRLQSHQRITGSKTKLTDPSILRALMRENVLLAEDNYPQEKLADLTIRFATISVTHQSVNESVLSILDVLRSGADC